MKSFTRSIVIGTFLVALVVASMAVLSVGAGPVAPESQIHDDENTPRHVPPQDLVGQLRQQTGDQVRVSYHAGTGKIRFIGTDPEHAISQSGIQAAEATPEQAARVTGVGPGGGCSCSSRACLTT